MKFETRDRKHYVWNISNFISNEISIKLEMSLAFGKKLIQNRLVR